MNFVMNCRHRHERLEEALNNLGHSVEYNIWDIDGIKSRGPAAVYFEFKQILKEEWRFAKLSYDLKKACIPSLTWCLDMPNIGASPWKLVAILKLGLLDIFATHSMQGFDTMHGLKSRLIYLPNAAWTSRYNLGGVSLEDFRDSGKYDVDVSFVGNIDSAKHREHLQRTRFLNELAGLLQKEGLTFKFEDSRFMDFSAQIDLIQRSRININVGCAADKDNNKSWGLPERAYGVPACGGFLLTDERIHAKDDFIEDDEIVMFRDINDCLEKILYYVARLDERRRVAENAYSRILREHTYIHRAETLLAAVCKVSSCG
ncbi:MAG TPA: glycosyltransferase [Dissulfurispiraceae bacterium]|nr:glycosyltransferase [Dissulfurispiraceae bacterium]